MYMQFQRRQYTKCFALLHYIGLLCGIWFLNILAIKAQTPITSPSITKSLLPDSDLNKVDFGQGWYYCSSNSQRCNLWNAVKVINIDPYQKVRYNFRDFYLSFPKSRPTLTSNDGRFSFAVGGMFQYDVGGFIGPFHKSEGINMSGVRNHLRRGRFIATARYDDFLITVTPDIGTSGVQNDSLFEASLRYQGLRHTSIEVGLLQPRVTMEDVEGSNGFEFVERPMIIDMVRNIAAANARLSLGATHWGKNYVLAGYVTGFRYGPFKNFQDNQIGGVFRAAVRPVAMQDIDLLIGVSGSIAFHGANRKYSMNTGTEAQIWLTRPFLRTGTINGVNSVWSLGPQVGFRWKRLLLKSEYYSISMQRVTTGNENLPNLRFPGWYVSGNYTLFGQPRLYDPKKGVFSPPVGPTFNPAAGLWGALEWSVRWSVMDFNSHKTQYDQNGVLLGSNGGRQTVVATGFNWYPSAQVRVMLDYNYVHASPSLKNTYNLRGRDSQLIISRLQLNF
ncbi:OprO/OprP family phosphate-selective porin [Commensalibacter oyaizuii]|uniref:Porin n=1 Tax=Commensalibacter oyaizuii TaxID=3043873 RepID=A0ABT6PYA4_9PROT|nr:porin [Commensalibacter sp. TBRC 16381]MDI2089841.1 porin [Commensalibacter sp. TBRC 16381]